MVDGCSIIGVGRKASADGSVFVSHSSDAEGTSDARLQLVPAANHNEESRALLWTDGPVLGAPPDSAKTRVIGYVPQVSHTYAYLRERGGYAAINERQVIMGESTCSSVAPIDSALPADHGGKALLSIALLGELAMERCDSALCAVRTMGQLAEEHGYFQDEGTPTGEALVVGDTKQLWIFHILPDPTRASAVWAATRVPEDHVVVLANMFIIREIDLSRSEDFLASDNIFDAARDTGNWKDGSPLDFTAVFSGSPATGGEYGGHAYSGRRVWRGYTLLTPTAAAPLSSDYHDLAADAPYPVTLPASGITLQDVTAAHRDYLQGTAFDLTAGAAAGPFGSPSRFMDPDSALMSPWGWERPISIFRCADSYVAQARGWLPDAAGGTLWWGPHVPHGTVYVPFAIGVPSLPYQYAGFSMAGLDRQSAFWAFLAVVNLAESRFSYIAREVRAMQQLLENSFARVQSSADAAFLATSDPKDLATPYHRNAARVTERWWAFFDQLVVRYADGFVREQPGATPRGVGYSAEWLAAAGVSLLEGATVPSPQNIAVNELVPIAQLPQAAFLAPLSKFSQGWPQGLLATDNAAGEISGDLRLPHHMAIAFALFAGVLLGVVLSFVAVRLYSRVSFASSALNEQQRADPDLSPLRWGHYWLSTASAGFKEPLRAGWGKRAGMGGRADAAPVYSYQRWQ